jgi:hypothetical protein
MTTEARTTPHQPRSPSLREVMISALDSAIRAPSTHNTQPWIFGFEDDPPAITLHADDTRALAVADPSGRELFISCGTVLHHLRVALAARGRTCRVERLPDPTDPNFVARVTVGAERAPTADERALEEAIHNRSTDNGQFRDDVVQESFERALEQAVRAEGASLAVLTEESARAHIADLVAIADRVQGGDSQFREELAQWLRSGLSDKRDGMLVEGAVGVVLPWIVRTFDRGDGEAARDRELIVDGTPALALISTPTDTPMDWIRAGESLSALLLRVVVERWSVSYFAQVVEVESTRAAIQAMADGKYVQLVLRLGRGQHGRKSLRRPVRDMLRG